MEITGRTRVYKNEYGYSVSDNQKNMNGEYDKFYIPVKFYKELTPPENGQNIEIKGFTRPYKTKEGKTGISYFIMDYKLVESQPKPETKEEKVDELDKGVNEFVEETKELNLSF